MAKEKSIDLFLGRLPAGSYESKTPGAGIHRQWMASCPNRTAHKNGDKHKSLSVSELANGKVLIKCFGGCTFAQVIGAAGVEAKDLRGVADPADLQGVTINRMALAKRLDPCFLANDCRLQDVKDDHGRPNIRIRYYDIEGTEVCYRTRARLRAKDGTYQQKGRPVYVYGVWRIPDWRGAGLKCLHLVEGESNSWTLWSHAHAALGIPGGSSVRKALSNLTLEMLAWAETIYVWQDPDATGEVFVRDCAARLAAFGFAGQVLVARHPTVKDPSDLHTADPDGFPAALAAVLGAATPAGAATPPPENCLFADPNAPWPPGLRLDWVGMAQRFAHRFRGRCLRDTQSKRFMFWDGCRWDVDGDEGHAMQLARDVVDGLTDEAHQLAGADAATADLRAAILAYRDKVRSNANWYSPIINVLSMPDLLPCRTNEFDRDPMILNCQNGILDLGTGTLTPSDPARRCSLVCGTRFDPRARCPTWEGFIDYVMDGDADLIAYLQSAFGYTLTALARRQEMYFLYGTGQNGKSSFVETMVGIMGDYYGKIDVGLILTTGWQASGDNNTLAQKAMLAGKRLVSTTEIPGGRSFNDGVIKDLASDEPIQACHKYGHPFRFAQTHKLWVFGNSRPNVKVTDKGFWRRLIPIPFSVTIPDDQKDEALKDKLRAEWPGILNWALEGLRTNCRTIPKRIREEQNQYRSDSDLLAEFLETETKADPERPDWVVDQTDLYKRYVLWCEANGDREVRRNTFYHQLVDRRFTRGLVKNRRVFHGIRLLTPQERKDSQIESVDQYNPKKLKDSYKEEENTCPFD